MEFYAAESLAFRTRVYALVTASILVFDHLCTLDREVNLVWKRGVLNAGGILFLINRYLPYVYIVAVLEEYWTIAGSQKACQTRDIWTMCVISVGLAISETIIGLRTWAIWNKNRRLLIAGSIFIASKSPVLTYALYRLMKGAKYINISSGGTTCISPGFLIWGLTCLAVLLLTETIVVVLTLIPAVEARRSSSTWYFKVHYVGVYYYIFNLILGISNMIGMSVSRNTGINTYATLQGVILSLLCNRVIFLAREPSDMADDTVDGNFYSTLRFQLSSHAHETHDVD